MKDRAYVYEFTGMVTPKEGEPFTETFYVVARGEDNATNIVVKGNPKVTNFVYTGKKTMCNEDW